MKKVLTYGRIAAKTRGQYSNAFVRSRLCYNVATWNNPSYFVKKLDTVVRSITQSSEKQL